MGLYGRWEPGPLESVLITLIASWFLVVLLSQVNDGNVGTFDITLPVGRAWHRSGKICVSAPDRLLVFPPCLFLTHVGEKGATYQTRQAQGKPVWRSPQTQRPRVSTRDVKNS